MLVLYDKVQIFANYTAFSPPLPPTYKCWLENRRRIHKYIEMFMRHEPTLIGGGRGGEVKGKGRI